MKIIQLMPSIAYGDAVSNHAIALKEIIKEISPDTDIYAGGVDSRLTKGTALSISHMPKLSPSDVIIYHAAIGTDLNYQLTQLPGRKIMIYHNITPPSFFEGYSNELKRLTSDGIKQMQFLADKVDYCIADSEFNKQDLLRMGFACPIDVCPLLIAFSDYTAEPSKQIIEKYGNDGYTNLLFVGRIAPNKKQENVIRAFYFYHKYFNKKSRLFLVGSGDGPYYDRLQDYVAALDLTDSVIFTGHIKFNEILAYYKVSDAFLCMSEHEGFCVPLVEAMYFKVPVLAFNTTAIPYTLGGSGILLESNEPITAAEAIHGLLSSEEACRDVIEAQNTRLQDFDQQIIADRMLALVRNFINKVN